MRLSIKSKFKFNRGIMVLLIIMIALILLFGLLSPDKFLTSANFESMAFQMPEFGLLCLGMMLVILTGGINLSLVASCTLSCIMGALVMSSTFGQTHAVMAVLLGCLVMLVTAAILGALNGFVSGVLGVPGMLATLGSMSLFEGISLVLTKGGSISGFPDVYYPIGNSSWLGIPIPIFFYIAGILFLYFLLERTTWGFSVYMVGINPTATTYSGIRNKKILFMVYVISGFLIGLAAVIMSSRYNSARFDYGSSYLMKSILAVVLGGTAIEGGKGKVIGVVLSVAILQILSSGLNLLNVNQYITNIITGILLIVVLFVNYTFNEIAKRKLISQVKHRFSSESIVNKDNALINQ